MSDQWNLSQVGNQKEKTVIITGANSGIGFESARVFASYGARVIFACRDSKKAEDAIAQIREGNPAAELSFIPLNLASLASIRQFAEQFVARYDSLDVLLNNAGIMMVPYGLTVDGFESQLGTNHFGHFALTGLLIDRLVNTPGSRIVNISSNAHYSGEIDFSDLFFEEGGYTPKGAYDRSKLANLLFTYELQRRLENKGESTLALAAHPGISATGVADHFLSEPFRWLIRGAMKLVFQSAAMGALPGLRAAVDPQASGGQYYGPDGKGEKSGYPIVVDSNSASKNEEAARTLWERSEELTGVAYLS